MADWGRAKRFFTPENSLRVLELTYATLVVSFSFGWSDKGVEYSDLNDKDYNECNNIFFFMMIGMITFLFLLCVNIYSMTISPHILSPCFDIIMSGGLTLLMIISSVVLAHALSNLGKSVAVREAGLTFGTLQTALVFGMALGILFALSTAFAVHFHRRRSYFTPGDSRTTADLPDDIPA